jgi:competence protein ComEA
VTDGAVAGFAPAGGPAPGTARRFGLPPEWQRVRVFGGGLLILLIAFMGFHVWRGREPATVGVQPLSPGSGAEIKVQVAGAVARPGVYPLKLGDRVEDAVNAAGGLADHADTSRLNLAQRVRDEQRLDVPFAPNRAEVARGDRAIGEGAAAGVVETAEAGNQPGAPDASPPHPDANAPRTETQAAVPASPPPPAAQPASTVRPNPTPRPTATSRPAPTARATAFSGGKVNVNTATAAQLEQLPGIGEVSAQRIIAYRQANGRISSLEQLRQAGIGEALLRRAADYLAFD